MNKYMFKDAEKTEILEQCFIVFIADILQVYSHWCSSILPSKKVYIFAVDMERLSLAKMR